MEPSFDHEIAVPFFKDFTPYLGGLIADRFLGYRKSVLIGGLFFALGFFLMSIYGRATFVGGLVLSASPYAYQLFAEVVPLRGVLIGIFFTAVLRVGGG